MSTHLHRREMLASASAVVGTGMLFGFDAEKPARDSFTYCLNTSTIRGQKLPIAQVVEITAKAGYTAIEPWIRELDDHVKAGGTLKDLGKRIRDNGLTVESAIGFAQWIADDDEQRKKGLEEAKRTMDMVRQIGGTRLAAPPSGGTNQPVDLVRAAHRYRAILEIGDQIGVAAEAEVWGFSKTMGRLAETVFVAVESGHPKACLLPDVYHLYKGGSSFNSLRLLHGAAMPVFHMNDYPDMPRETINDSHRVYPGDGVAPIVQMLRDLRTVGFAGVLSLELFNRDYWEQDPLTVARTGLEKMKAVVQKSLA